MGLEPASGFALLAALTLNLHGYHPTGEERRWLEDRSGRLSAVDSDLFFFSPQELDRGHRLRLDRLARGIGRLSPDIVFLQEAGA